MVWALNLLAVAFFLAGFFYFPLWIAAGCLLLFALVDHNRSQSGRRAARSATKACPGCGTANRIEDYRCMACGGPI